MIISYILELVQAGGAAFDQLGGPGAEPLEAIDFWRFKTILIRFQGVFWEKKSEENTEIKPAFRYSLLSKIMEIGDKILRF